MRGLWQLVVIPKEKDMILDPSVEATAAIVRTMTIGSSKDGTDDSWRLKKKSYHLEKAMGHARKAYLMETGQMPQDGEDHGKLALTRLAMSLCID